MKKKSLSVKKKILKNLYKNLKKPRINKVYKKFKRNFRVKEKNTKIAIAVSGGADSLALSYFIKCLSIEKNLKVYFYTVNHNLRSNSSKEALQVKKKLKNFGINCEILKWIGKKPTSNIQYYARKKRYELIFNKCLKNKINTLLTAHNQNDLYENFFIRMLRGSGLSGIASFSSVETNINGFNVVRPLLDIDKNDLIYVTKEVFNFYIDDPSNENEIFTRVRIRKLIQKLKKEGLNFKNLKLSLKNLNLSNNTINYYVEENLNENTHYFESKSKFILNKNFFEKTDEIKFRSINRILTKVSKEYYAPRGKSTLNLLKYINQPKFKKTTLHGCIIEKLNNSVIIYPEIHKKS